MRAYGTKDLINLVGIPGGRIRSMIRAGHLSPKKDARGALLFSFRDLIVLRTAKALSAAAIPTRRINSSLKKLRQGLPTAMPLTGLSITSVGDQVAVREGARRVEIDSGQYILALDVVAGHGEIQIFERNGTAPPTVRSHFDAPVRERSARASASGEDYFALAASLEEGDPTQAIVAYQHCLSENRRHPEARVNCGRLLHLTGRLTDAEKIYREAPHPDGTLLFNLGVLLEDLGREAEAMSAYRDALDADPSIADAHFNLARLHERAGNQRDALKHLLAYHRAMV